MLSAAGWHLFTLRTGTARGGRRLRRRVFERYRETDTLRTTLLFFHPRILSCPTAVHPRSVTVDPPRVESERRSARLLVPTRERPSARPPRTPPSPPPPSSRTPLSANVSRYRSISLAASATASGSVPSFSSPRRDDAFASTSSAAMPPPPSPPPSPRMSHTAASTGSRSANPTPS